MRITDFPELVTATGNDLLVTVDIANDVTKKIKLENLPTSIATTVALATKQNLLVSGTSIKTINSTTLLGSGDIALQPMLVSGTNIKTLNSVSLLGSGDIVLTANPSGVAGAIQFSNGSAFASDASNLFWDDTNNRLGIGTNAPTARAHIKGVGATSSSTSFLVQNSLGHNNLKITDDGAVKIENDFANNKFVIGWPDGSESLIFDYTTIRTGGGNPLNISGLQTNIGSYAGTRLTTSNTGTTIYGSGSTSATTSLLVQNSAGSTALQVTDDQILKGYFGTQLRFQLGGSSAPGISTRNGALLVGYIDGGATNGLQLLTSGTGKTYIDGWNDGGTNQYDIVIGNQGSRVQCGTDSTSIASAQLAINSTTRGFLPPRMSTTQRDAIVSVVAGLVVYNASTNKLQCYNGSTWNDLF